MRALSVALLCATAAASLAAAAVAQQRAEPVPGVAAPATRPPEGTAPSGEAAQKGDQFYLQNCAACHGATGRGGPGGAPDLTASAIAMANDGGRQLAAFLQVGRPERGMPPRPVNEEEAANLSAKLRALGFAAAPGGAGQGSAQAPAELVLVGDVEAGRAFFNGPVGRCYACHAVQPGVASPASNLSKIGQKYPDPKTLQNNMLLPGRRFYWSPSHDKSVTAVVTWKNGRTVKGYLSSVSDFKVIVRDEAGAETTIERTNGEPRIVLQDRLQHHLDLFRVYRDNQIHDLTAYLATLK
jgi:cytochrome c oxidase cbb3-type subunit 3